MPVYARFLTNERLVEVVFRGQVSEAELRRAVDDTISLAANHQTCLCLADCLGLGGGHSFTDLYDLVALLEARKLGPQFREAILLPANPAAAEQVRFYETACFNRGINVRIFSDRAEAIAWLRGS